MDEELFEVNLIVTKDQLEELVAYFGEEPSSELEWEFELKEDE